jgi:hypothetical protein
MMGDALNVPPDAPVQVTARWSGGPAGVELSLIVNGRVQGRLAAGGAGEKTWDLEAGAARWCLLTLRDADGMMLALTNPIYLDGRD